MLKLIYKIINILFIFIVIISITYLLYGLLAILYLILDNIYILDALNERARFTVYYLTVAFLVSGYSIWEGAVYSDAEESGDIQHWFDTDSVQAYRRKPSDEVDDSPPSENTLLVRSVRRFKDFLDSVIIFLIHTLIPTFFKLIFVSIYNFYETSKGVFFAIYSEYKVCYIYLRSEFTEFEQLYGVVSIFNKIKYTFWK